MIKVTETVAITGKRLFQRLYHRSCYKRRSGGLITWAANLKHRKVLEFEYCRSCQTHINEEIIKKAKFILGL